VSNFITGQILAAGGENEPMPSVLAVPIDELVVGLLAFFIVFGVLAKVALPKIKETLAARSEAIEGGLRKAEEAQAEAQRAQEDERRQGPVDRRTGARRRVPEPEGNQ
jgi:F-type H+-transporting ATPase subunit b